MTSSGCRHDNRHAHGCRLPVSVPSSLPAGDTTAIPTHPEVAAAVRRVLDAGGMCGYALSSGLLVTRQAIAELYSPYTNDERGISAEVRMCSQAQGMHCIVKLHHVYILL